ncbi:MAG: ATP-binding protein [Chitinophagaceae bacterium]|jgi:predicted AAA+ superfamily ATPase|nr:ATP-binding protein [Chitinophagaceae bacterium]
MYIKRHIDKHLSEWKSSKNLKPLLLRGARQVGKSSSVRELGKTFDFFLEINFEKKEHQDAKKIFERHSSPKLIVDELYAIFGTPIIAGKTLLFIDEIQNCVPAVSSLRFFYEEMPDLHVIAAGSLLEFALEELPSYGVGRIRSLFMYPMSFNEYLNAMNLNGLANKISAASVEKPISEPLHKQCLNHLVCFIAIGGMPEVVAAYAGGSSLQECQQILNDLVLTYNDDFAKYKKRVPASRLKEVFFSIMEQTGNKFVYSRAVENTKHESIKTAVELLIMAGLVYPVTHSAANGVPLAAELNHKHQKIISFDTGIMQQMLKLDISKLLLGETLEQINRGSIAEMFAGLEIVKNMPCNAPAQLFYWQREQQGSQAEIDYLIESGTSIIPIEVKAGTRGAMQSLHQFMVEKGTKKGIRISLENFGKINGIDIYPVYAISTILH